MMCNEEVALPLPNTQEEQLKSANLVDQKSGR